RALPVLAALTVFPLAPHSVGFRPQSLRRLALGILALALAGKESLALAEVLVVGPAATAPATITIGAATALGLATATQVLAGALLVLHRAKLVEGLLHGLERPILLSVLERFHPFRYLGAEIAAALAPEALHLLQQLLQLLWRDLIGTEATRQRLRLLEDHLVLARPEVGLEVRTTIQLRE